MKAQFLLIGFLVSLILIPALICAGVCLADDGSLSNSGNSMDWRLVWLPILTFLWSIYDKALRNKISEIWHTKDNFWWKVRGSFIAVFTTLGPCLKEVVKRYGGIIVNFAIQLFKNKFNVASIYRAASVRPAARPRRL